MARWQPLLLALAAACAAPPESRYVPGGTGLAPASVSAYREAVERERAGDEAGALARLDALCDEYPDRLGLHLRRLDLSRRLRGAAATAAIYEPAPAGVSAERAAVLASLARLPAGDLAGRRREVQFAVEHEPGEAFWRLALADLEVAAHEVVLARAEREVTQGQITAADSSRVEARAILERGAEQARAARELDATLSEAELLLGYVASCRADLAPTAALRDGWRWESQARYREAIRLDPASITARLNLAESYAYFDSYEKAIDELRIVTRLAPSEAPSWRSLGHAYFRAQRYGEAVDAFRRAVALEAGDLFTRIDLADALRRSGDPQGAVATLVEARRATAGEETPDLDLARADIAFQLGALHEHARRYEDAVREYRLHVDLDGRERRKAEARIRRIYETAFEEESTSAGR